MLTRVTRHSISRLARSYLAFAAALLVLAFVAWTSYRTSNALTQGVRQTVAIGNQLRSVDEILSTMQDAETGERGYLLTGDAAYLEPYNTAVGKLGAQLAEFRALSANDPRALQQIDQIETLANGRLAVLRDVVLLQRGGQTAQALAIVQQGRGKLLMDQLRQVVGEVKDNKSAELQAAVTDGEARAQQEVVVKLIGAGLAILLLTIAAVVLQRELTARERAERKLRETLDVLAEQNQLTERSRSEARAVLDAASEGMLLLSPEGRILTLNRRFGELFGVEIGALVGRHLDELPEDLRQKFHHLFADFPARPTLNADLTGNPTQDYLGTIVQTFPVQRELQLYSSGIPNRGRLYVLRDITREKEVDRMKTEFVSLVSHELRTPLTSIKGFVELILDDEDDNVGPEQREYLLIIKSNTDRMVALINDLLDVSRIESGHVELDRSLLNVSELIAGVCATLRPQIQARQQSLTVDVPETLPPVSGDAARVVQIVTNLLSNAHKYTPVGGQIWISATAERDQLCVAIRDSGIGLTEEDQKLLFTRFFRANNRATREVGGTGLGLVITRSLVELHGGELTVTSRPGQGSTFRFTLPLIPSNLQTPAIPALTAASREGPAG